MDEPIDNKVESTAALSHFRLILIMGIIAAAGTVVGFLFFSGKAGSGFLVGGLLSFVNYFWMKRSLRTVFEEAPEGEKASFAGGGYLMRYVAFATVLGTIYLIDWELMVPVILGLSSFALAVVFEGFIRLFASFGKGKEI